MKWNSMISQSGIMLLCQSVLNSLYVVITNLFWPLHYFFGHRLIYLSSLHIIIIIITQPTVSIPGHKLPPIFSSYICPESLASKSLLLIQFPKNLHAVSYIYTNHISPYKVVSLQLMNNFYLPQTGYLYIASSSLYAIL